MKRVFRFVLPKKVFLFPRRAVKIAARRKSDETNSFSKRQRVDVYRRAMPPLAHRTVISAEFGQAVKTAL